MKTQDLMMLGLLWGLPIIIGVWFSISVWLFSKKLDYRIAAALRALAVVSTFTPGSIPNVGFVPVPASVFLFIIPPDSSFVEQASAAIPPIGVAWLVLMPVFLLIGYLLKKKRNKGKSI
jgi:hypothetical protein